MCGLRIICLNQLIALDKAAISMWIELLSAPAPAAVGMTGEYWKMLEIATAEWERDVLRETI